VLAQDAAEDDEAEHEAEHQVHEVRARVDRGKAQRERDEHEHLALAREA
jgi:hypothetical protein